MDFGSAHNKHIFVFVSFIVVVFFSVTRAHIVVFFFLLFFFKFLNKSVSCRCSLEFIEK